MWLFQWGVLLSQVETLLLSFAVHDVNRRQVHFHDMSIDPIVPATLSPAPYSYSRYLSSINHIPTAVPTLTPRPSRLFSPFQKLSSPPQRNQGGSVSSPHASQPSQEESSPCSDISSYEEPPSPLSAASSGPLAPAPAPAQVSAHRHPAASDQEGSSDRDGAALAQRFLPNDPTMWNVEEVYEFIRSLPGQRDRLEGNARCIRSPFGPWC